MIRLDNGVVFLLARDKAMVDWCSQTPLMTAMATAPLVLAQIEPKGFAFHFAKNRFSKVKDIPADILAGILERFVSFEPFYAPTSRWEARVSLSDLVLMRLMDSEPIS